MACFGKLTKVTATLVASIAVPFGLSAYLANAIGQLAAFAVLALSLDLIWGYLGILSLGHGLFFDLFGCHYAYIPGGEFLLFTVIAFVNDHLPQIIFRSFELVR